MKAMSIKDYFGLLPKGVKITDLLPRKHILALKVILLGFWQKIGLHGGRGSLKSTLAFVASILYAMHGDGNVLVLCKNASRCRCAYELIKWLFGRIGFDEKSGWRVVNNPYIKLVYHNPNNDKGSEYAIHIVQMTNESLMRKFNQDKTVSVVIAEDVDDLDVSCNHVHHLIDHAANRRQAILTYNKATLAQNGLLGWFKKHCFGINEYHFTYKNVPLAWLGKGFYDEATMMRGWKKDVYEVEYLGEEPKKPAKVKATLRIGKIA